MNYKNIETMASETATNFFNSQAIQFPYHNLFHTKEVVKRVTEIAACYQLDEEQVCSLHVAAWFHDVGQLFGEMTGHEDRSAQIMKGSFNDLTLPVSFIDNIAESILATETGMFPSSLPQKIICDADTFHFGTVYFRETEFLVQNEIELRTGKQFENWHFKSLEFLKRHVYYTEYCQLMLADGKKANIAWLESLL